MTTPEVSAIRDADRIIGLLQANEMPKIQLIINRLRMDMVKRGEMMSVEDVTEILAVDLLGAIPDDEAVVVATNQGEPLCGKNSPSGQAFENICRRISGEAVPLMDFQAKTGVMKRLSHIPYFQKIIRRRHGYEIFWQTFRPDRKGPAQASSYFREA